MKARCWWPIFDPDIEDARARLKALVQIPRIAAENHWLDWGDPAGWRYEEGTYKGEPTLFLVCDLDVVATPAAYVPGPEPAATVPTVAASLWASQRGVPSVPGSRL